MNNRLKKLVSVFGQNAIDGLIVTNDTNIRYLTSFEASESWLFVTAKKIFYITDSRYLLETQQGLKGISVVCFEKSFSKTVFELAQSLKLKSLGFDSRHFSLYQFKIIQKNCPKTIRLKEADNLVEGFREIKDRQEIDCIRTALKIHQKALGLLQKRIKPGLKEQDVLETLEKFIKVHKVGFSFPPIIASGSNSCFPHARVTGRKIQNNEPVLVDMGIDFKGYKSDLTRMFFLGKIPQFVNEVNTAVKQSQLKAIEEIKAGVPVAEVDQLARKYLAKHKLEKFFGHSLGHGVGLDIHESPRLSKSSSAILKEGMVVTVEPGVYIPHKFGIRIEDMVLVKKQGCEVLSGNIDH